MILRWLDRPYAVAVSRVLSAAFSLISAVLLARALGPRGRGEASAALAVVGLLPIALGIGLPLVVRRAAAIAGSADEIIRAVRILSLALTLPAIGISWLCLATVLAPLDQSAATAFLVSGSCSALGVLWICNANVLVAHSRSGAFALANVLPVVVYVVLVAAGSLLGILTVGYAIVANLAGNAFCLGFTSWLVPVRLRGACAPIPLTLREGMRYAGSQIAEAASYRLDQAIALPVVGGIQAGFYSVAATIALIPFALGQALGTATFRGIATANVGVVRAARIATSIRASIVLSVALVTCMAVATPLVVPLLWGSNFVGAVAPTLVALVGAVAVVISYVASSALTAMGKGWLMTWAQLVGLSSDVVLLLVLGPAHGAMGLAVASVVGYALTCLICISGLGIRAGALIPHLKDFPAAMGLLTSARQ